MKRFQYLAFTLLLTLFIPFTVYSQSEDVQQIRSVVSRSDIEAHTTFLSSDELRGRATGNPGLKEAADYIASKFQSYGVATPPGLDSYFQPVPIVSQIAPDEIVFSTGDSTFVKNQDLLLLNNYRGKIEAPLAVLEHASRKELRENDVADKIVISQAGLPGETSPQQFISSAAQKMEWIEEAGAAGLIEIYSNRQFSWQTLVGYLGGDRIMLQENRSNSDLPHLWFNGAREGLNSYLAEHENSGTKLSVSGRSSEVLSTKNVVGIVQGSDPELDEEYILLSAHYDHIGVTHTNAVEDSIYNGARDNAVGVAAILSAGKYFAEHPPKRSILLAAWTAEENGLLGSQWFAENPVVPLDQIVYNLNIDNGGYNDTTKVTVVGLGRTEADSLFKTSAGAFGLEAIPDPVPGQGLFNRSDNVHFARRGIPSPTYSMGFTAFDEEIRKYYHQVTDEASTINFDYVTSYIRSYILSAQKIANTGSAPFWLPGDEYEQAGIELYGRD